MGDIAKGVLGGGWSLLVGWILPTAINLGILAITMGPSLRQVPVANQIFTASPGAKALLLLIASVLTGLILNALQVPLYRVLEGYLLWPARLYARRSRHHRKRRSELADELTRTRRARRAAAGRVQSAGTAQRPLTPDGEAPAVPDPRDEVLTATQQALLGERLARYPVQDDQVTPTRLGNAIRRLEEYGYDRYRLDSQVLWNELTAMAPEQARRQVDTARTSVDFFIALLYGHTVLVAMALCATSVDSADPPVLLGTAGVLCALCPLWYRAAVAATDEWAAAVRALVNLGRHPLAQAMGLDLPQDIAEEREMWRMVSRMSRSRFHDRAVALNRFRTPPGMGEPR
ncbi:hypothetical protein ADL01_10705 [Streptomyces sp. NRRL WC-3618]|uniref:hypothetical protein n=1 Tax=Streptomyces sp. NRRL WC-3618 TaxID=1519490 RepID=UPI0006ADF3EE|nr:hypothetical protein [Streptomyces sp. NRRL WC-3618]KOV82192.1 hypothetical protein ADL01_10705 [Streptomyces sp. NRRL WC-3618]